MNYSLKIFDKVFEELNEATLYYNEQQIGLGVSLLNDWENALKRLLINPLGYEKKQKQYRQIMLTTFPYLIIFKVTNFNVIVTSFINAKRNPVKRYKK